MIPLVIRLPLDPTGTSPDNKVVGEPHTLSGRQIRAIAPHQGGFFSKSLSVVDRNTGIPLTKEQYYPAELYQFPSNRYGQEICAIAIITDPTVSNNVAITYQALGAEFSTSQQAIIQQIERLQLDSRPVAWPAIIGKPSAFTPSAHLHDAGDIYGFEYLVFACDRIRDAILLGDVASHDAIYAYIDHIDQVLRALIGSGSGSIGNHIADKNNPHEVTAGQLNVFTKQEVTALLSQSISGLSAAINARIDQEVATLNIAISAVNSRLDAHITDRNNPHAVTAAQVNAYTKPETDSVITGAVNASSVTINARITNEISALSGTVNSNQASNTAWINGIHRAHMLPSTTGTGAAYAVDATGNLTAFVNTTGTMRMRFHASNNGIQSSLTMQGTSFAGNLIQMNGLGEWIPAIIVAGQLADVAWDGNNMIVLDALPPVVKPSLEYFATIPAVKTSDAVIVAHAGLLDWRTIGAWSGYVSKDIGKLFYDAGPMRPFCVELNGTRLGKADYPQIWAWAQASGQVTIQQYYQQGMFYFVDVDANTFAVPDMRNVFVRGYGTDSEGAARPVGGIQGHGIASHGHTASSASAGDHHHGSGWGESQPGDNRYGIYDYTRGVGSGKTDYDNYDNNTSTNGAHTHAIAVNNTGGNETRPFNVAMSPRIQLV